MRSQDIGLGQMQVPMPTSLGKRLRGCLNAAPSHPLVPQHVDDGKVETEWLLSLLRICLCPRGETVVKMLASRVERTGPRRGSRTHKGIYSVSGPKTQVDQSCAPPTNMRGSCSHRQTEQGLCGRDPHTGQGHNLLPRGCELRKSVAIFSA